MSVEAGKNRVEVTIILGPQNIEEIGEQEQYTISIERLG